jgi:hypothetical protein
MVRGGSNEVRAVQRSAWAGQCERIIAGRGCLARTSNLTPRMDTDKLISRSWESKLSVRRINLRLTAIMHHDRGI